MYGLMTNFLLPSSFSDPIAALHQTCVCAWCKQRMLKIAITIRARLAGAEYEE